MEKDIVKAASGDLTQRFNIRSTDELKALAEGLDVSVPRTPGTLKWGRVGLGSWGGGEAGWGSGR